MGEVPQVPGDETVKTVRNPSREDAGKPRGNDGEPDGDAPQHEPEEVGDDEEQAKEDGQAAPREVIGHDQVDRMRRGSISAGDGKLFGHGAPYRVGRALRRP